MNNYDVRSLKVHNQTGTVYVNGHSKGYLTRFFKDGFSFSDTESLNLPYDVKDKFRIEVVRNVDVQPKFKSMYLHKDNKYQFRILHGSGHFSVSINNTELADKVYVDQERTLTIIPKKEGPIEIRVEDVEIPDSVVSVSELLISDISRLELDAPGTLIEQGSQMNLTVTAFDAYGNKFDDDQYTHMQFNIEIEITQPRDKGLSAEADPLNNRKFIARGYEPGNYQSSAFTYKYRQAKENNLVRVNSEMLKIEVFP